ncbi:hypothetical protein [Aurantiacibacter spongiae]|nr:hypothetical protein [Aurantiacibacter spongiae]
MTTTSNFSARLMAALAAVAMTASLFAASFSTPQASVFTTILA